MTDPQVAMLVNAITDAGAAIAGAIMFIGLLRLFFSK